MGVVYKVDEIHTVKGRFNHYFVQKKCKTTNDRFFF